MLEIEIINNIKPLRELRGEWNQLLAKSHTKTVFLTHEWITNWWECFGKNKQLYVVLVRDNNKLLCIAPLMKVKIKPIGINHIQFIGTPSADFCDLIMLQPREFVIKQLYDHLISKMGPFDTISLNEIPVNSATIKLSKKVLKKYYDISFANKIICLNYSPLDKEEVRKKLKKKDINRNIRKLEGIGRVEFGEVTDKTQQSLERLFLLHMELWDQKGMPSMFQDKRQQEFLKKLTAELFPKRQIGIYELKLDDKTVAIQFGFNYNNTYSAYCTSYDTSYAKTGPGSILFSYLLDHLHKKGFSEVDFGRGAESYKYRFSNQASENMDITVHKNPISHMTQKTYNKVKKQIMENERLHGIANRYKNRAKMMLSKI